MVHVRFDPSSISHYSHQVGYGLGELSYFKGLPPYQRRAGLNDIFKGIWRISIFLITIFFDNQLIAVDYLVASAIKLFERKHR